MNILSTYLFSHSRHERLISTLQGLISYLLSLINLESF